MSVPVSGALRRELAEAVSGARLLVVGAGGIGCELLKDLVLTGFNNIDVIDLDTIDVSNLNRQFLFQKKHVGRSKAQVAKESVLQFYPEANIIAYHDSIMKFSLFQPRWKLSRTVLFSLFDTRDQPSTFLNYVREITGTGTIP